MVSHEDTFYYLSLHCGGIDPEWYIKGPLSANLIAGMGVAYDILHISNERDECMLWTRKVKPKDKQSFINMAFAIDQSHIKIFLDQLVKIEEDNELISEIISVNKRSLHQYIIVENIPLEGVHIDDVEPGYYYIWIKNEHGTYDLYQFTSMEFIQGFISMCNAFKVNYQAYILGPVFTDTEEYEIKL